MNHQQSYERKLDAIRQVLRQRKALGVRLVSQRAVNWLTNIRSFINQATESSVAEVIVTLDDAWLVTNNIEVERIAEEELNGIKLSTTAFNWYEPQTREQVVGNLARGLLSESEVLAELTPLQLVLDDWEVTELKELSFLTASAVEAVARQVYQGESEFEIAGRLAKALLDEGIEPIVNLVAGDERALLRRHPLPTRHSVSEFAMLVVCGRRRGLIASVTRSISFGTSPAWLQERQKAVTYVDAAALSHSQPGVSLGEVLTSMQKAYAEQGFPDEWRLHHQGGLTGYASRMALATPNSSQVLSPGMAVAWNPTIAGVKSEDTCLVSNEVPVILSQSHGDWPYLEVDLAGTAWERPSILERKLYTESAKIEKSDRVGG